MPFGDGTGPLGQGSRTGRGMGGRGRGGGQNNNAGPGGYCVCPGCGAQFPHQAGTPCSARTCPNCGARLVRQ
ncbi:MAG: hypothetical protein PVH64_08660 [Bacillota bacterium]